MNIGPRVGHDVSDMKGDNRFFDGTLTGILEKLDTEVFKRCDVTSL